MIDLSPQEWIELLSKDYKPNDEEVVLIPRLRKSGAIVIKKGQFEHYFGESTGLQFEPGTEIEITCPKGESKKPCIPEWALNQLAIQDHGKICITKRGDRFFLKAFELREFDTKIVGPIVIDTFTEAKVTRDFSCIIDFEKIDDRYIDGLLTKIGKFKHNPLTRLKQVKGFIGFLGRRDIFEEITPDDIAFIDNHKNEILELQDENGSWLNSTVRTSFNIIRLLELGCSPGELSLKKAIDWLLSLPEPIGLPGLFLFSEKISQGFNKWKSNEGIKGRPYRKHVASEIQEFADNLDLNPILIANPCETRITWPSAIAIEALLKAGLEKQPRVVKAINTLLLISKYSTKPTGVWCGCGYMDAKYSVNAETSAVDFNWQELSLQRSSKWFSPWYAKDDIPNLVSIYNGINRTFKIGGNSTMVVSLKEFLACSLNMHRALSNHPDYPGSQLEELGVLAYASNQNSLGLWNNAYYSSMLDALHRFKHPLASFLVLRTIPLLKRIQGRDGMWQEQKLPYHGKKEILYNTTPPTKEECTYRVLKTLKKYDMLDRLT